VPLGTLVPDNSSNGGRTNQGEVTRLYANLAIGLAFSWWVEKHHRHQVDRLLSPDAAFLCEVGRTDQ
jgi:hypothetical protein